VHRSTFAPHRKAQTLPRPVAVCFRSKGSMIDTIGVYTITPLALGVRTLL
jgi:hypothetical protein